MTSFKIVMMGTVAVVGLASFAATARASDAYESYRVLNFDQIEPHLTVGQRNELDTYLEKELEEPCQNYLAPPVGFMRTGCDLYIPMEEKKAVVTETVRATSSVLNSYGINFDFDSDRIDENGMRELRRVASEIGNYNPGEVTVAGFTDTSGSQEYNQNLSKRRAQAVSDALTNLGVANRVITEEAYGETVLAVPTADEVKLRANRRVLVEFRK